MITFKTNATEGLLFFSSHKHYRDFIQLRVAQGLLEFRFDAGDGPVYIRSSGQVNTGEKVTAVVMYVSQDKNAPYSPFLLWGH